MSNSSLPLYSLAWHLYTLERKLLDNQMLESKSQTDVEVYFKVASIILEKLRPSLTQLAGSRGYLSLVSRALSLTKVQYPSIKPVRIGADGDFDGFNALVAGAANLGLEPENNAGVYLITRLLELLTTFIGGSLTLSLLKDAWPNESFEKVGHKIEVKS